MKIADFIKAIKWVKLDQFLTKIESFSQIVQIKQKIKLIFKNLEIKVFLIPLNYIFDRFL